MQDMPSEKESKVEAAEHGAGRRTPSSQQAKNRVRAREAQKAFQSFYTQCFWSFDPDYRVTLKDIPWIVEQLKKNGNQRAWKAAERLCP